MEEDTLSGRKEDTLSGRKDTLSGRKDTLSVRKDTLSGRKEDHTQGRLQQREDYIRRKATAGMTHTPTPVGARDAVETSVNHCLRTRSSL